MRLNSQVNTSSPDASPQVAIQITAEIHPIPPPSPPMMSVSPNQTGESIPNITTPQTPTQLLQEAQIRNMSPPTSTPSSPINNSSKCHTNRDHTIIDIYTFDPATRVPLLQIENDLDIDSTTENSRSANQTIPQRVYPSHSTPSPVSNNLNNSNFNNFYFVNSQPGMRPPTPNFSPI